jgi:outer membrane biosynthesis protein TonB
VDIFRPEPVIAKAIEEPQPVAEELEPEPPPEIPEPSEIPDPLPEIPELPSEPPELDLDVPESPEEVEPVEKPVLVDLGAYEVASLPDPEPVTSPSQARVPALAATAPVQDRSGIFGAVRAAFVRNKGSHDHEFVEAPGGIGIIRHICSECGYISIGVSESD